MGSAPQDEGGDRRTGMVNGTLPPSLAAAFANGGEMGGRLAALDWSATPVGAPHTWPASLRQAVAMMLSSESQIVMYWGDEYLAFYNDAYLPTIGAKHPAALGRPARHHWSELWQVLEPLFDGVRRSGRAYRGKDHPFLLERHGYLEETYFDVSYDPLRRDDGTVGGIFCIVSETTGRVLGERRLRALAEFGSRLSDLATWAELGREAARVLDGYQADVPFSLVYLGDGQPGAERLTGWSGVTPDRIIAPRGPDLDPAGPTMPPALARVLAGGAATTGPLSDFLAAGPDIAADQVLVLPITATAEPAGALVVGISRHLALTADYRDFFDLVAAQISSAVTSQRAYEHERSRAADLAALDRAKTNFFANVSHEFRTPLTLILGPLEDALADRDLPVGHRESLAVVYRNGLRLLKLVNTLLDFSRLESGRLLPFFQPTDLADYTARLASTFRSAIDRAGLRLVVDCPPLPEPVLVDRDMWEKVVLNLLSNALKFTFEGEITVRLRAVDGMARLEVADTGVGISPDEIGQIFKRFHRVIGVRSRSHEGTGIGLALVRELTETHGGTVGVRSQPEAGSIFTVAVPFGGGHLPPDRIGPADGPPAETREARLYLGEAAWWSAPGTTVGGTAPVGAEPAEPPGQSRGRVLVADDNADLRDHVVRLLAPYWQVVAVADGAAAFDAAVGSPFDLVLTDVMMPKMDGFALVTRLRADRRTRHVPIVILSARAGTGEEVEGLAAGADDYLVKPFSGQELIARVRSNVELGQLRGQIIRQLRALADAAVAVNTARSTADVLRVAADHALEMVQAGRVVASAPGLRYEADGGGRSPDDPSSVVPMTGTTGEELGELRVWPRHDLSTDTEEAALAQLARLVGLRLENARLYEAEHRIATTLQHSLLPSSLPRLPGAIVASRYLPGNTDVEVGGDWYDVIPVDDGQLVLVIGDVVGKGVAAAAAMGQLRNALRAYVLEGFDPGQALTRLNRLVGSTGQRSFATVAFLWFDPQTGRLRFASAGHPPALLIGTDGAVRFTHERALGPPVGALPDSVYRTVETRLEPGQRLLLYTDGLIEDRRQGIDTGLDQLRLDAATSCDHVEDLVSVMIDRVAGRPRRDDVAILALEASELNRFALRLPADPTRLSVLRKRLEDFLIAHQVGETDLFDLTVAVSEAAANAIEHPVDPREPVIAVTAQIADGVVDITVRDTGQWRESTDSGFRGRGLALIGALGELTVRRTPAGTEVHLRRVLQD
ncbi:SpoIIE family protein phosphatase [Solwaraspora sp. WMMD1047]|uniref:SpoIIE family protein phosphatase n=1 Tax=Solwaraspora sp. WMMD1047 TaxID=3016102 RepID=UPI0024178C84|nr:SpoIIE family protein phosphatase [Solwaraspora sp. WMMD1047]MDG4829653.1 SpoIIE family protein phosphatase [Solwaraspora sp. WMMD1047]